MASFTGVLVNPVRNGKPSKLENLIADWDVVETFTKRIYLSGE